MPTSHAKTGNFDKGFAKSWTFGSHDMRKWGTACTLPRNLLANFGPLGAIAEVRGVKGSEEELPASTSTLSVFHL